MKVSQNADTTITIIMDRNEAERIQKMLAYGGYSIAKSIEFGDGDRVELNALKDEAREFHRQLHIARKI